MLLAKVKEKSTNNHLLNPKSEETSVKPYFLRAKTHTLMLSTVNRQIFTDHYVTRGILKFQC